jgi:type III pantothenate kinase
MASEIKNMKKTILIAIDIGNTSISIGVFAGKKLVKKTRINTKSSNRQIYILLKRLVEKNKGIQTHAMISSVVPRATVVVENVIKKDFKLKPIVLGRDLKVPIRNLYHNPAHVGQDRLVNAYACKEIYGKPAIVIDFGTATTFDYINSRGQYEGGIITPGVEITINSLAEETALLPKIQLKTPRRLIGKDTQDSISSGVFYGLAGMCDGLIEKIKKHKKNAPLVLATGGLAGIFCPYSKHINQIDHTLTLKGLYLIFSKKTRQSLDN